jgi:regulator of protease activity HflC (stomatin/prohibitin superfamily)
MQIIYIVPQSHCVVLERFGKYARLQNAGINIRIPFLEKIKRVDSVGSNWSDYANKNGYLIELTEQLTDTPSRECHTRDNAKVTVNASIYWRIIDPVKAIYNSDNLPANVADVALNALRANIGSLELDAILSARQDLNDRISAQLSESGKKWGVIFTRVEIQELKVDQKTSDAMLQQLDSERKKRAMVAEAEGKAQAEVMIAEANKNAAVLRAEGQAKALELTRNAEYEYLQYMKAVIGDNKALELLLAQKYIIGFETITKNPADKVFLPNSISSMISMNIDGRNNS